MPNMLLFRDSPVATAVWLVTIAASLLAFLNRRFLFPRFALCPYAVRKDGAYYMLISSGLIHADFFHLLFNMLTFYFFAFRLERFLGSWRFCVLYFAALVISGIPSVIRHRHNPDYTTLGASGAVSAVVFSYILFRPTSTLLIFPLPFPIYAFIFGFLYLGYCFWAAKKARDNINHEAHYWGALAGIVLTIIMRPRAVSLFLSGIASIFSGS